jgi:hypothetical protein
VWQVSTNGGTGFTDLQDGGNYSGTRSTRLMIVNAATAMNGYEFRIRVSGGCGVAVLSNRVSFKVNPVPEKPRVVMPSRCGDGPISAAVTSSAFEPVFRWYVNETDAVPVYAGDMYTVSNLTQTGSYYVSVTSLACESPRAAVTFTRYPLQSVPLGGTITLCRGQGLYNLENDISAGVARGSQFTWTANGTTFQSTLFDPSVGAGTYVVNYDPPALAKATPDCYVPTSRTIKVITTTADGGIVFNDPRISNGNTVNACLGDDPIIISQFPSVPGGGWTTVSGTGLSFSGNAVVFTPGQTTYTAITPNTFRYTVQVGGCSATRDLNIYVKDNPYPPVVSGLSPVVCPETTLTLAASVATPGSFTYEWTRAGEAAPFATGNILTHTVKSSGTLQVRSINTAFGCRSAATTVDIQTPFASSTITTTRAEINTGEYIGFQTDALDAGNTFVWSFGDGATSTEKNPVHYYYATGTFSPQLRIQSNLGCAQTLSTNVSVVGDDPTIITGVELREPKNLALFPNPATAVITIRAGEAVISYRILDAVGVVIGSGRAPGPELVIDVSELRPGIYLVEVITASGPRTLRFRKA